MYACAGHARSSCIHMIVSSECDRAMSTEIMALLKHTLVHITATVSQVSVYS